MALKFLDTNGLGWYDDAAEAIYYATNNGADIISNSWGGGEPKEPDLKDAIDYAYSQGVIQVAVAGNFRNKNPVYPAYYDHMISVAATDSNDGKASFSTYGEWVDLAAPGVDILSLRPDGTSVGTFQDYYKTVASGTSMACPHVSGACALLLSVNPYLTHDDVNEILIKTVDVIFDPNDEICRSNGRLNLYKALLAAVSSKGSIDLDQDYYNCDCNVGIFLADSDLAEQGAEYVNITTSGGDSETVCLTETGLDIGVFTGEISTASGEPNTGDGILQVSNDETIIVTYEDANDGTGNPASPNDTATVDCVYPVISNIDFNETPIGPDIIITFDTNELCLGRVLYGLSCGGAYISSTLSRGFNHTVKLKEAIPLSDNYFIVEVTDLAGNKTVDSNNGNCYRFTTDGPRNINVPADYNTIQEAIDQPIWDGSTIRVAEGSYYELIDFKGKAITVTGTNPDDWDVVAATIIDGNSPPIGRTVIFHSGEGANSILRGFMIKGSFYNVYSVGSSPIVSNCIVEDGMVGIYGINSSINIVNNIIMGNFQAGMRCWAGEAVVKNNWIYRNGSAGIILALGEAVIKNNWIYGNNISGIALRMSRCSPIIRNNTIFGNKIGVNTTKAGPTPIISNCIIWGHKGNDLAPYFSATYSCIEDVNDANGVGNITSDPCFLNAYDFFDITDADGTKITIIVADANLYEVNDVIEYNDDGAVLTVTDVNIASKTVTFAGDSLDTNSVKDTLIYNWGPGVNDVNEDLHLLSESNCIDAGDPNGAYSGQVDIDAQPRVMVSEVDMGADETAYLPSDHNDYNDWVAVGKPDCWCFQRQCRGDADGRPQGRNSYWVSTYDNEVLVAAWNKTFAEIDGQTITVGGKEVPLICADFDHNPQGRYNYRVSANDLSILIAYWQIPDGPDPNCFCY